MFLQKASCCYEIVYSPVYKASRRKKKSTSNVSGKSLIYDDVDVYKVDLCWRTRFCSANYTFHRNTKIIEFHDLRATFCTFTYWDTHIPMYFKCVRKVEKFQRCLSSTGSISKWEKEAPKNQDKIPNIIL